MQKALLTALLLPNEQLKTLQDKNDFSQIMYLTEKFKFMPIGDIWDEYLARQNLSDDWYDAVEKFEKDVIEKR